MEQKSEATPPSSPNSQLFMKLGQVHLIYAANCFSSLLCLGNENHSLKSSCWRAYEDIMVFGSLSYPSCLDEKLVFPSHLSDKGFITTLAYYWSKEILQKRYFVRTFIGSDLDAVLKVHRWKKYIVLKMSAFPVIKGIIFFLFFFFSFFSSSFSSFMCMTASKNIQILKHYTGFLKTGSNDFPP